MPLVRVVVTLVLALTLCCATSAAAQAIGPMCLEAKFEANAIHEFPTTLLLEIFALPMVGSSTGRGSQFLLSASINPHTGSAFVANGDSSAYFILVGAYLDSSAISPGIFSGTVDLKTRRGVGTCRAIGSPTLVTCGRQGRATLTLLPDCD